MKTFGDAKSIRINLDGMVKSAKDLPDIVNRGKRGIAFQECGPDGIIGNITNREIATIFDNPELLKKATFYLDGKKVKP